MSKINFYTADITYQLKEKRKIKDWIINEVSIFKKEIEEVNIILCSDEYLLEVNKKFLNHFDFTDVITFDNSMKDFIIGEIYISVDRVKENAKKLNINLFEEFLRIIIHGTLHLVGYSDKKPEEKLKMTSLENDAIERFKTQ